MPKKMSMRELMLERARSRMSKEGGGNNALQIPQDCDLKWFKFTKEKHLIDVVGYIVTDKNHPDRIPVGEAAPFRIYYAHKSVGADEKMYLCAAKTHNKPCPICEHKKNRKAQGASFDELKLFNPQQRMILLVRDIEAAPDKLMLWDVSYFSFGKMLDTDMTQAVSDIGEEAADYYLHQEGMSLRLRAEKQSFNGRDFYKCTRVDFLPRKTKLSRGTLEQLIPLDDVLSNISYEALEEIFFMGSKVEPEQESDIDDDYEAPKTKRNKPEPEDDEPTPARKKRPAIEVDEDDDVPAPPKRKAKPEPEPEEDDDPTPPKRKAKKEPEPEEGDEDMVVGLRKRNKKAAEEDEEDEKPKKKSSAKTEECPFEGGVFGVDTDNFQECDDCRKFMQCNAAKQAS